MKLRVMHENGNVEVLTLTLPVLAIEGIHLNRLSEAVGGRDHFFTKDGFYDGWGQACGESLAVAHATNVIEKIESTREIEKPLGGDGE